MQVYASMRKSTKELMPVCTGTSFYNLSWIAGVLFPDAPCWLAWISPEFCSWILCIIYFVWALAFLAGGAAAAPAAIPLTTMQQKPSGQRLQQPRLLRPPRCCLSLLDCSLLDSWRGHTSEVTLTSWMVTNLCLKVVATGRQLVASILVVDCKASEHFVAKVGSVWPSTLDEK